MSGVQQVTRDLCRTTMKKLPPFGALAMTNPFLFGAATGFPMWALTRVVATPLQNRHRKGASPYDGFAESVTKDLAYPAIRNGLGEYVGALVLPKILPGLPNFATQRFVEAVASGIVGGGSYILAWPYKTALAGQKLDDALKLAVKQTPRAAIKRATYTLARPKWAALLQ
jgi:hypothetical protein